MSKLNSYNIFFSADTILLLYPVCWKKRELGKQVWSFVLFAFPCVCGDNKFCLFVVWTSVFFVSVDVPANNQYYILLYFVMLQYLFLPKFYFILLVDYFDLRLDHVFFFSSQPMIVWAILSRFCGTNYCIYKVVNFSISAKYFGCFLFAWWFLVPPRLFPQLSTLCWVLCKSYACLYVLAVHHNLFCGSFTDNFSVFDHFLYDRFANQRC